MKFSWPARPQTIWHFIFHFYINVSIHLHFLLFCTSLFNVLHWMEWKQMRMRKLKCRLNLSEVWVLFFICVCVKGFFFSSDDTDSYCVLCGVMLSQPGADGIRFPRAPAEVRVADCNDLSFLRAISLKAGETEPENCSLSFTSVLQHIYNIACVTWIQTESILYNAQHDVHLHMYALFIYVFWYIC